MLDWSHKRPKIESGHAIRKRCADELTIDAGLEILQPKLPP